MLEVIFGNIHNLNFMEIDILDFKNRIQEKPYFQSWHNGEFIDSCRDEGKINYKGLNDHQKLCLYVYSWNTSDILPGKKGILKKFGWTNYKLQQIIKDLKGKIITEATFSEQTGLLSGRGYLFNVINVYYGK